MKIPINSPKLTGNPAFSGVESDKTMVAANDKGPGARHRKKNQFYKLKLSQHDGGDFEDDHESSNSTSPVSISKIKGTHSMRTIKTQNPQTLSKVLNNQK